MEVYPHTPHIIILNNKEKNMSTTATHGSNNTSVIPVIPLEDANPDSQNKKTKRLSLGDIKPTAANLMHAITDSKAAAKGTVASLTSRFQANGTKLPTMQPKESTQNASGTKLLGSSEIPTSEVTKVKNEIDISPQNGTHPKKGHSRHKSFSEGSSNANSAVPEAGSHSKPTSPTPSKLKHLILSNSPFHKSNGEKNSKAPTASQEDESSIPLDTSSNVKTSTDSRLTSPTKLKQRILDHIPGNKPSGDKNSKTLPTISQEGESSIPLDTSSHVKTSADSRPTSPTKFKQKIFEHLPGNKSGDKSSKIATPVNPESELTPLAAPLEESNLTKTKGFVHTAVETAKGSAKSALHQLNQRIKGDKKSGQEGLPSDLQTAVDQAQPSQGSANQVLREIEADFATLPDLTALTSAEPDKPKSILKKGQSDQSSPPKNVSFPQEPDTNEPVIGDGQVRIAPPTPEIESRQQDVVEFNLQHYGEVPSAFRDVPKRDKAERQTVVLDPPRTLSTITPPSQAKHKPTGEITLPLTLKTNSTSPAEATDASSKVKQKDDTKTPPEVPPQESQKSTKKEILWIVQLILYVGKFFWMLIGGGWLWGKGEIPTDDGQTGSTGTVKT